MVDHQAQIVQEIADTIKCAADVAMRLGDPVWCELVFVSFPDQFGEGIETVHIGAMAARAKVRGEVVRLHLHLNDLASLTIIRNAIRVALEPLVVSGRQFIVHDTAEGVVVALVDHGKIQAIHHTPQKMPRQR